MTQPQSPRILSLRWSFSSRRLIPLLLPVMLWSCGQGPTAAAGTRTGGVAVEVRDLIAALTPLPATAVPVLKSDWYKTRKETLARLRGASHEHGLEALRLYREDPPASPEVRAGLLDVAAHAAPAETTPVLVRLVTQFGEDLLVRTQATEFLGECAPLQAVETIEPILRERFDDRTYPPEERLLAAWIEANRQLGLDPVPLLASIATDLHRAQEVRHLATHALGEFDAPESRQALQALVVESSGNGYVRRLALQSLLQLLPKEEFCQLAKTVQSHEADPAFVNFLESALNSNCR